MSGFETAEELDQFCASEDRKAKALWEKNNPGKTYMDAVTENVNKMRNPSSISPDCSIAEAVSLLRKIEACAHGHCDGARMANKTAPGIRDIASWAAKAQAILSD